MISEKFVYPRLVKKLASLKLQKQVLLEIISKFKCHGIFLFLWIIKDN